MDSRVSDLLVPSGAYLAWRYNDARHRVQRGRIYWDDGRVESIEDYRREEVCRLDPDQKNAARAAVLAALGSRADPSPDQPSAYDTASVVYAWRLNGHEGQFGYDYPPEPPAIATLEARLTELEEASGGWPLLADE